MTSEQIQELEKIVNHQKKIVQEIISILNYRAENQEKQIVKKQLESLRKHFKKNEDSMINLLNKLSPVKKLKIEKPQIIEEKKFEKQTNEGKDFDEFEITSLERLRKIEKKQEKKVHSKPSLYVKFANNLFSNTSKKLINKGNFRNLSRDLISANLRLLPKSYVSVIFLTTLISVFIGFFLMLFFLFFSIGAKIPFIFIVTESFGIRFLKVFWLPLIIPLAIFVFMYFYPSMEKRSIGSQIDQELPFATIHMAAIAGSMVEPSKIFKIMISTSEYPNLEKEFIKLMNEVNIFGYDLTTALKSLAFNSPSKKLAELFNGLSTAINSGGDLQEFFEKRSETLLLDYRLEREKYAKNAETFMDIYISVVIAAPMILMLLLMMMKISGLGVSLSIQAITLMMVLGVGLINIFFLVFLQMRQPSG